VARFVPFQSSKNFFAIDQRSLNAVESLIKWAETDVPALIPKFMNELVFYMAVYNQGVARKMAFGPYDPSGRDTSLAWRTPEQGIRRISERYYLGWKVNQVMYGVWRVYNDSREAYYIEFGISTVGWGSGRHVPARRIRRPVRKLSQIKTLEWALSTGAYHRIWADIYKGRPPYGFTQIVQSRAMGSFTGPGLGRRLPG
jgi:hypothetical protein